MSEEQGENIQSEQISNEQAENEELQTVRVAEPLPLDAEKLKLLLIEDIISNSPQYLAEIAERKKLDIQKDMPAITEVVYNEQIGLVVENCIKYSLDENTIEAYKLLQKFCYFNQEEIAYMSMLEGQNLPAKIADYLEARLQNVPELKPVVNFVKNVNEAILYATNDYPNFTSYRANQLKEEFDGTALKLTHEEKGKLNFIASKMYRKLGAQSSPLSDNQAGTQEIECLNKVLLLSSDYKLISYCQNRMPKNKLNKNIIRAYKNALSKTKNRGDLYKINSELANLYAAQARTVGYVISDSDKAVAADKAIRYMLNAYRYAEKEDRLPILRKVSDVQLMLGRMDEWQNIREVIAMKFLKGEERCYALDKIGDRTRDISFYQKALAECEKARLPKNIKLDIQVVTYEKIVKCARDEKICKDAAEKLSLIREEKKKDLNKMLGYRKEHIENA